MANSQNFILDSILCQNLMLGVQRFGDFHMTRWRHRFLAAGFGFGQLLARLWTTIIACPMPCTTAIPAHRIAFLGHHLVAGQLLLVGVRCLSISPVFSDICNAIPGFSHCN